MEESVARLMMTRFVDLRQQQHEFLPIAQHGTRNDLIVQAAEEAVVTGEQAAIEQRNIELWIVAVEAVAIVQGASGGTQPEPEIPQVLTHSPDCILARCRWRFSVREKQQIHIRVRRREHLVRSRRWQPGQSQTAKINRG